jgi:hypothetical protein
MAAIVALQRDRAVAERVCPVHFAAQVFPGAEARAQPDARERIARVLVGQRVLELERRAFDKGQAMQLLQPGARAAEARRAQLERNAQRLVAEPLGLQVTADAVLTAGGKLFVADQRLRGKLALRLDRRAPAVSKVRLR